MSGKIAIVISSGLDYSKLGLKCKASISFNLPADKIDEFISLARKEKRIKKIRQGLFLDTTLRSVRSTIPSGKNIRNATDRA